MSASATTTPVQAQDVAIPPHGLRTLLAVPSAARGLVLFAHGSGSGRLSPRNQRVAGALQQAGFATLLLQLKEHSTAGAALTMRNVQGKRKTVYEVADELPGLNVPTLIVSGDEDELALEPALLMKRKIPNSGLLIVPKTGHTVNLEEPALFNQAVFDFISAVDQGAWTPRRDTSTGLLPPEK